MTGKIYKIIEDDILFAYRDENHSYWFHYVCLIDGEVIVWCFGGVGKLSKYGNHIVEASEEDINIWNSRLKSEEYKWNTANCILMDLNGNIFNQEI